MPGKNGGVESKMIFDLFFLMGRKLDLKFALEVVQLKAEYLLQLFFNSFATPLQLLCNSFTALS